MGLSGRGFLALWNGVAQEREPEYNLWHTREHVPERVDIPGMIGARRYVDGRGTSPRFFTLYDLESTEVLTSPPYRRLLENPTVWSRSMRPSFRGFIRFGCITIARLGGGTGGAAATATLTGPLSDDASRVSSVLAAILQLPGISAAHFGAVDRSIPDVPFTIGDAAAPAPPGAVVVLEGFDLAALESELVHAGAILHRAGLAAEVPDWTAYRLGYMVARDDLPDLIRMSR